MLKNEKRYDFKKELLEIHKPDIRDFSLIPNIEEFVFGDIVTIVLPKNSDSVIYTAARDFTDYLFTSMQISSMISKTVPNNQFIKLSLNKDIEEASGYMGYRISVCDDHIDLEGYDNRGIAQGLYFLEDLMNLRKAPFIKKGVIKSKARFSPRIAQSPFGMFEFTDECFALMAHRGYDAVDLWLKGVNLTKRGDFIDLPLLCERAEKYGLDTYAWIYAPHSAHPDDEGSQEFYDNMYGKLFEACPKIKGIFLVGEATHFSSRDPKAGKSPASANVVDNIPTGKTPPGWWPCSDYPQWVDMIKCSIRKYKSDAEVIFCTYNWGAAPKKERLELINNLPTDITLCVGWEMYQEFKVGDVTEFVADYTLRVEGPGDYFISEAEVAKKRGIKVMAIANSAGRTWDFGVIPYEPMPYQWIKRFNNMIDAKTRYGLGGILECIHYGFQPSFIGDLEKWASFEHDVKLEDILKKLLARDFGEENLEKVDKAMMLWSEAICHMIPAYDDQYGALRIGPSYPIWFGPNSGGKIPNEHNAMFGNDIYFAKPSQMYMYDRSPHGMCIELEKEEIMKVADYLKQGIDIMETITEPNDNLLKLINLGWFMYRTCITVRHVKEFAIAEAALMSCKNRDEARQSVEKMEKILKCERENVEATIPIVRVDSRLGWEPSMEYMGDEKCLNWKLRQVDYTLNKIIPNIRKPYELH